MASDDHVESIVEAAPSATSAAVQLELPKAGPATNASKDVNNIQQETEKSAEGVRTTPAFPWNVPSQEDLRQEFAQAYTVAEKDEAFNKISGIVKQYSNSVEMVKRWNEEIDNLLVYAGLFSAILTAFNVQSYILLQPSTPDPTLLMLQQISQQLNSFSLTPPGALLNSTHPVSFTPVQASPVEAWAIWLNSLWFSGLIFSLASASIGIMVKQWIHEYQAGISGDSLDIARLRQYRLNNLVKWHIAEIVAFLPVLLQIALFLFFSGLLILLWQYHSTVAIVASVHIGIVALFMAGTTIMPLIWRSCCYLSPPVYLLFNFAQHVKFALAWLGISILWTIMFSHKLLLGYSEELLPVSEIMILLGLKPSTWFGREQLAVQSASSRLDIDMTLFAYATTRDTKLLPCAVAILASHDFPTMDLYHIEVQMINKQHFGHKNIEVQSPDFLASRLIYSFYNDYTANDLWILSESYRDSLSSSTCHRLLLALAAVMSKSDVTSDMYRYSLLLLEKLLTLNTDALRSMPWNAISHVAAAIETYLRRPLRPSDDELDQETYWKNVFLALGILVQCCFTPVSSWQRSPKDMRTCMQYTLGLDFLQKESLRKNVSKLGRFTTYQMMKTLTLILTYLGESAVDAWDCRPAAEDFMEAVRTVIELLEASSEGKADEWIKLFQRLKEGFRDRESLELSNQVVRAQTAEHDQNPPEPMAFGPGRSTPVNVLMTRKSSRIERLLQ